MNLKKTVLMIFLSLFILINGKAQQLNFNVKLGACFYQGDLSPRDDIFSASQACAGLAIGLQYYKTKYWSIYGDLLIGGLKGDDLFASDYERRKRNLHFKTRLIEFGVGTKYSINHFLSYLNQLGVNVEVLLGLNVFHFNPKAQLNGHWVYLRPLGTEGQGWLNGENDLYSNYGLSISSGFSVDFEIADNISGGFEVAHRKTFTDYIDDVSSNYVNYDEQISNSSKLAAQLSNRTGELIGESYQDMKTGTPRGNSSKKDAYFIFSLVMKYRI